MRLSLTKKTVVQPINLWLNFQYVKDNYKHGYDLSTTVNNLASAALCSHIEYFGSIVKTLITAHQANELHIADYKRKLIEGAHGKWLRENRGHVVDRLPARTLT